MAHRVTVGPIPSPPFVILFGKENRFSVYVYDDISLQWRKLEYLSFRAVKRLNQMSDFEIETFDIQSAEKTYIKEFAEVMVFAENFLFLKGRIQRVEYGTNYMCKIIGFGMESALVEKQFLKNNRSGTGETESTVDYDDGGKRVTFMNLSAQQIAEDILSTNSEGVTPWIMAPNTASGIFDTDYGTLSIRFEYTSRLKALIGLTESINYDWWISHSAIPYDTDYFNLASRQGSASSVKTYTISGSSTNCELTLNEKDINDVTNRVDIIGFGDGQNQVKTDFYDASDVFSTLTANITNSATSIVVADGSSFPSAGILKIGREYIPYTTLSTHTFTVVRPYGAIEHKKSVLVYEWYDGSADTTNLINMADGLTSLGCVFTLDDSSSFDASGYVIIDGEIIKYDGNDNTSLSTTNSTLNGAITSTDTTITLTDASSFASSGYVLIGNEVILYTGVSSNDLTGCIRNVLVTEAAGHATGTAVYQFYRGMVDAKGTSRSKHKNNAIVFQYDATKHYTDGSIAGTSAKTDSSISDNGLLDGTFTDRTLRDEPTAELIATKELTDKKDPVQRIKLIPIEPLKDAQEIAIGDNVTITDAESDLSGDYRVVGATLFDDYGMEGIELEVSNKGLAFLEQMASVRDKAEKESKYMLGATNLLSIGPIAENCDDSNPLNLRFYLPPDVKAINSAKLSLIRKKYRAYSSASSKINNDGDAVLGYGGISHLAWQAVTGDSAWTSASNLSFAPAVDGGGIFLRFQINMDQELCVDDVAYSWGFRIKRTDPDTNVDYFPSSGGVQIGITQNTAGYTTTSEAGAISDHHHHPLSPSNYFLCGTTAYGGESITEDTDGHHHAPYDKTYFVTSGSIPQNPAQTGEAGSASAHDHIVSLPNLINPMGSCIYIPENPNGSTYELQIAIAGLDGSGLPTAFGAPQAAYDTQFIASLSADIVGTHTHGIDFAITESAIEETQNIKVEVGTEGSEIEVATLTDDTDELDVTDYIPSLPDGGWVNIKFTPVDGGTTDAGLIRLDAAAFMKVFIES